MLIPSSFPLTFYICWTRRKPYQSMFLKFTSFSAKWQYQRISFSSNWWKYLPPGEEIGIIKRSTVRLALEESGCPAGGGNLRKRNLNLAEAGFACCYLCLMDRLICPNSLSGFIRRLVSSSRIMEFWEAQERSRMLGKYVRVKVVRPIGAKHPRFPFTYRLN